MKLKNIYINNMLSFKDTYVLRAGTPTIEHGIPISDTITVITGKNNTGKTNFLRCIRWLFNRFLEPDTTFTFNGDSIHEISGQFKVEQEDFDRLIKIPSSNIKFFNTLKNIFAVVKTIREKVKSYASMETDLNYTRAELNEFIRSLEKYIIDLEKELIVTDVKEKDTQLLQLTTTANNRLTIFLNPYKENIIARIDAINGELQHIEELVDMGTLESSSRPLYASDSGAIAKFKNCISKLRNLNFAFATNTNVEAEIAVDFFRTKFIDESKNLPIAFRIAWSQEIGKDIEKIIGGAGVRKNPDAVELMLNKIVNEKIRELQFPLLKDFKLCFSVDNDFVKITLYDPQSDRFFTMHETSLGIRWLLSLWFQIYAENFNMPDLLIIDEPGFNMHPGAQKELIKIFEQIVDSFNIQIIYTTHSPFMINANRILDVRLIKSHYDQKTKSRYSVVDTKAYKANFEPLCTALGLRFVRPYLLLEKGKNYYIVEGESDAIIMMTMSQLLFFHGEKHLDLDEIAVYPAGGATRENFVNAINNIRSVSDSAEIIALVDGDTQGLMVKRYIESKYVSSKYNEHKIGCLCIADVLNRKGVTIEDIIPLTHYIESFNNFYTSISHAWGDVDVKECVDFIRNENAPMIESLVKYFNEKKKEKFSKNDLNKVGIARTLTERLLDIYGEHGKKDAFTQSLKNGQVLIAKLKEVGMQLRHK